MSGPPPGVANEVVAVWSERVGHELIIAGAGAVGGGCISPTARLQSNRGDVAFLKWGEPGSTPAGLFGAEAMSLRELRSAGALRVPEVLGVSDTGAGWLLLEWLEPARATADGWRALGRRLAALHRTGAAAYGWPADNFIGSLPQANARNRDWAVFWREQRLEPQLRRAYEGGFFGRTDRQGFERLLQRLPELLAVAADEGPSLVHGDLWGGNVHFTTDGAALIDPASYYGHREVDLAMSELFGGFEAPFQHAYREAWPLPPGYPVRRAVYQIYYLLVHVNLFGGGYVSRTLAALAAAQV